MSTRRSSPNRVAWAVMTVAGLVGFLSPTTRPARAKAAVDCGSGKVHCVDDTAGAMQEFRTIQAAVDRAKKGHTVVVAPGTYAGFRMKRSGSKKKPILVQAQEGARIVASEARSDDGIYVQDANYVTIEGFEVDGGGSMRYGVGVHDATANKPMRGVTIRANRVHGSDSTAIYVSNAANSLIENNEAFDSRSSHGIYLANGGSDDTVLRANDCHGNAVNGIHFNGDASVGGDGLHTGLLVDSNRIWGNDANGIDADGVQRSTFENNLIFENGRHGLRAFAIDAAAGPQWLTIVNNTIVGNAAWAVKLTQDAGGHRLFNNILLSGDGSIVVESGDLMSDYNVVQQWFSRDGEDTVVSLASWQAAGLGTHSFKAKTNKLFEKARKDNYHLRRNSPAIDVGAGSIGSASAPLLDIDGLLRPQGKALDLGAYESPGSGRGGAS